MYNRIKASSSSYKKMSINPIGKGIRQKSRSKKRVMNSSPIMSKLANYVDPVTLLPRSLIGAGIGTIVGGLGGAGLSNIAAKKFIKRREGESDESLENRRKRLRSIGLHGGGIIGGGLGLLTGQKTKKPGYTNRYQPETTGELFDDSTFLRQLGAVSVGGLAGGIAGKASAKKLIKRREGESDESLRNRSRNAKISGILGGTFIGSGLASKGALKMEPFFQKMRKERLEEMIDEWERGR